MDRAYTSTLLANLRKFLFAEGLYTEENYSDCIIVLTRMNIDIQTFLNIHNILNYFIFNTVMYTRIYKIDLKLNITNKTKFVDFFRLSEAGFPKLSTKEDKVDYWRNVAHLFNQYIQSEYE